MFVENKAFEVIDDYGTIYDIVLCKVESICKVDLENYQPYIYVLKVYLDNNYFDLIFSNKTTRDNYYNDLIDNFEF